ncbi:MAG TPA: GTP pyrophosphokinase family protein [Firmicutes bacterium]|nr:GTP pyrophosphokinase family protein [Bacillota bacterium]
MELVNWKEFLYPYEQAVAELTLKLRYIMEEYKRLGLYCPMDTVLGRVKQPSSILEKARKKQIPEEKIEEEIEDIAGVRVICQFVEDIPKVISLIRRRNHQDLIILEERDYIKNTKPSGYRSYHIIIRYPVQTVAGSKDLLAEIQIRTLAMNFWAVAEHSLKYKYHGQLPQELQDRLVHCAEAAFNLDNEMSTIRNEIMYAQRYNKIKDGLLADILDLIQGLYSVASLEEMEEANKRLVGLWETGSLDELKELKADLAQMAQVYGV